MKNEEKTKIIIICGIIFTIIIIFLLISLINKKDNEYNNIEDKEITNSDLEYKGKILKCEDSNNKNNYQIFYINKNKMDRLIVNSSYPTGKSNKELTEAEKSDIENAIYENWGISNKVYEGIKIDINYIPDDNYNVYIKIDADYQKANIDILKKLNLNYNTSNLSKKVETLLKNKIYTCKYIK